MDLSNVAIMDRLAVSGEWFRWMNTEIMKNWVGRQPGAVFGSRWKVRLVDGTRIKEPGPTGSSWRMHYSIDLPSLRCDESLVSSNDGEGESLTRFTVHAGELFVGDRAYGARNEVIRRTRKEGTEPRPETLESAGYIFVFTTVGRDALGAADILEMYRGRWQIELVFKRSKSIPECVKYNETVPFGN